MSRGHGWVQRAILEAIEAGQHVRLAGATKSETTALKRAADKLASEGKVAVVQLWDGDGANRRVRSFAFPPDMQHEGRPIKEVSVDRVSRGTRSAFIGSIRHIALSCPARVSATTVWRDLRRPGAKNTLPNE